METPSATASVSIVDTSTIQATSNEEAFILVVDDEPTNLSLLKNTLSSTGLKIRLASSGLKALELTQKALPKLILLDISMPDMDGFETCKRLKSNPETAPIPIIFVTAFSEVKQKIRGFSLGAVDYITKPFQVEEVLARVSVQLSLQALTNQLNAKNHQLEQQLEARTRAENQLHSANQQLQHSLEELKRTQAQLVQSEKMSGLGQLVAGIAHEINNPLNFIKSNLRHAENYFYDCLKLLDIDREKENRINFQEHSEDIDLDFIRQDFERLLFSMKRGCDRVQHIVLGLRNFSRLDESGQKFVDLTEGLDNTLLILQHRFSLPNQPVSIQIQKCYGDIPLVYCYASQINQVFLQILTNAIDFLSTSDTTSNTIDTPTIHLLTEMKDDVTVRIRIIDNGPGISEEVCHRIFDPFFSTKPVGQGVGLGLAISYQIVTEQHKGSLHCSSQPEQGAEFVIELPVTQHAVRD